MVMAMRKDRIVKALLHLNLGLTILFSHFYIDIIDVKYAFIAIKA